MSIYGLDAVIDSGHVIELGHATDTTIARSAAGVVTIEGVEIVTLSRSQTLTNKTLTSPALTTPTIGGFTINATAATTLSGGTVREVLTGARTYYVRTDGSNSNNGLANTAGGAFLTIQKAIDTCFTLDLSTYNVTIQVGSGSAYDGFTVSGPFLGSGTVTVTGDTTTPSNVIITATGTTHGVRCQTNGNITVSGLKLACGSGIGVLASTGGTVNINGNMEYGACASYHMLAQTGGTINPTSNYSITGNSGAHMVAGSFGTVKMSGLTVTLTGTPAFTDFTQAFRIGLIEVYSMTYSGSATGNRYSCTQNSVVFTNGGGANFYPGNAAGTTATGGQYI